MSFKPVFITILVFAASAFFCRSINALNPWTIQIAAATAFLTGAFLLGWHCRRYVFFSLSAMLLAVLTLQIPIAMLFNPWQVAWLTPLGVVLLMFWMCGIYLYALDRGLSRYVREHSLQKLKAAETKGIGKL